MAIVTFFLKEYAPYLFAFVLGVLVASKGCQKTKTVTIEKPVPTVEYVDRWKTDSVRFVTTKYLTKLDTIYKDRVEVLLDTLLLVDTVSIVQTWLTEVAKYDTTIKDPSYVARLTWQNYQNRTEKLTLNVDSKKVNNWALGVHGIAGLSTDFERSYVPLFGLGAQLTVKKNYFSLNYGYNGRHYIGAGVGRNLISK
jgi:hypothetical protein